MSASPDPPVIDAHQHLWNRDRAPYDRLGPHVAEIDRTIEWPELAPRMARTPITRTVLVQAADDPRDDPVFAGARALIHDRDDPDWLPRPDVTDDPRSWTPAPA